MRGWLCWLHQPTLTSTYLEHEGKTTIGEHMRTHGYDNISLSNNFNILKNVKISGTASCLRCFFIRDLKSMLNKQKDSISSKLF